MDKLLFKLFAVASLVVTVGCAHSVHVVHVSDFSDRKLSAERKEISSYAEQFVVLSFVGNTDYVNEAYDKLKSQCQGGEVTGISTQYSTSLGFFSWTNKIRMEAICVQRS